MWLSSHQPWPAGMGQALPAQQPTEAWLLCYLRVGNQWRSSWAWGSLVSSTGYWWEVQLYQHLPTWALCSWTWSSSKAMVLLCSLPGKEGTSLPRGSDGELRHYTVTSGIWLICGKIFTDNCNWSFIGSKMACRLQLDEWMLLRETGRSSEHRGRGEEPCSHRCRQPRWPPDTEKGTKEMPHDKALSFQTICLLLYLPFMY